MAVRAAAERPSGVSAEAAHPARRQAAGDVGTELLHEIPAGRDAPHPNESVRRRVGDLVEELVEVGEDLAVKGWRVLPARAVCSHNDRNVFSAWACVPRFEQRPDPLPELTTERYAPAPNRNADALSRPRRAYKTSAVSFPGWEPRVR